MTIHLIANKFVLNKYLENVLDDIFIKLNSKDFDNSRISIKRVTPLETTFSDFTFEIGLNVDLYYFKDTFISDVTFKSILNLGIQLNLKVQKEAIKIKSSITDLQWIEKPKLDFGIGDVNVKWISKLIFNTVKDDIEYQMDQNLNKHLIAQEWGRQLDNIFLQQLQTLNIDSLFINTKIKKVSFIGFEQKGDSVYTSIKLEAKIVASNSKGEFNSLTKFDKQLSPYDSNSIELNFKTTLENFKIELNKLIRKKPIVFRKNELDLEILHINSISESGIELILKERNNLFGQLSMTTHYSASANSMEFNIIKVKFENTSYLKRAFFKTGFAIFKNRINSLLKFDMNDYKLQIQKIIDELPRQVETITDVETVKLKPVINYFKCDEVDLILSLDHNLEVKLFI